MQLPSLSKATKYIFLAGFFLLPLFFWPWAQIPYELPKVDFVRYFIELLAVLTFLNFLHLPKRKINPYLFIALISWIVISTVVSLGGVDWEKSLFGNYYRRDGLVTLYHLIGFALVVGLIWQRQWKKNLAWAIVLGNTLSSIAIFTGFVWPDGSRGGLFGQPNFLAGYLLVTLPFAFYLILRSKGATKSFLFFTLIVQIIAIILTYSYVAIVGILILTLIWLALRYKKLIVLLLTFLLGLVALVGVIYIWWTNLHSREQVENPTLVVAESRERIYTKVLLGALKKPLTGYGVANVDYAFREVDWPIKLQNDVYVDKAHSHLLESFATTGIVGLIFYLVLLTCTFVSLFLNYKRKSSYWNIALLSSFFGYIFHTQTNITSISQEVIFWFLIGTGLVLKKS